MKKRYFSILSGASVVPSVLIIGAIAYFVWWGATPDLRGTFHNTANLADLDNDGDMDVIVQNVRNESEFTAFAVTTLWFNQGNGWFTAQRLGDYQHEAGWDSNAGDVDGDGDTDLLVFNGYSLRLDFNESVAPGEVKYVNPISSPINEAQFGSLLLGDTNNDGLTDGIVVGCCGRLFTLSETDDTPNYSWQWMNTRLSSGQPADQPTLLAGLEGLAVRDAALGDLDNDGDLDLFAAVIAPEVGRNTNPADRVLLNNGFGSFSDSGQRLGDTDSTALVLGDIDNDSDLDAIVGKENGAEIWVNQGYAQNGQAGVFALFSENIPGKQTKAVFLSDLDNDNDLDALIAGLKTAVIWWNDGQAHFTTSHQTLYLTNRHGLAIADFNNDKLPDIFAAEYNHYKVFFNHGTSVFRFSQIP